MSISREIISNAMGAGASDIHLEEDSPIAVRINSDIKISSQKIDNNQMNQLFNELIEERYLQI